MTPISKILISSSRPFIEKSEKHGIDLPLKLEKNEEVKAKVTGKPKNGMVELEIMGEKISAKTHVPLKPGDHLLLRQVESYPQQTLKIVDIIKVNDQNAILKFLPIIESGGPLIKLSSFIQKMEEEVIQNPDQKLKGLFSGFKKTLSEISVKSSDADHHLLKKVIQQSGLSLEANIKTALTSGIKTDDIYRKLDKIGETDLKTLALKTIKEIEGKEERKEPVKAFLEEIEHLQVVNKQIIETGKILLPLSVLFEDRFSFGQLFIDLGEKKDQDQEKDSNERLVKIHFFLALSNLGDVMAEFSVLKQAVTGAFFLCDQVLCDYVNENLSILTEKLSVLGFEAQNITCRMISSEKLKSTSVIDQVILENTGSLHIMI